MSSSKYIPVEIQDQIISRLSDDPTSLRDCGVVCQRWLDQSRHIYWSLYPLRFNASSPQKVRNRGFLDALSSGSVGYLSYVKIIELQGRGRDDTDNYDLDRFIALVAPSVEPTSLLLSEVEINYLRPETVEILMSFSAITSLVCKSVVFDDVDLYCKFFSSFHQLHSCTHGAFTRHRIPYDHTSPTVDSGFHELESFTTTLHRCSKLMSAGIVQSQCKLRVLSLNWMGYSGWEVVSALLEHAGENLRELTLGVANFASRIEANSSDDPLFSIPFTLVHNVNLKYLAITRFSMQQDFRYPNSWLKSLVGSIGSSSLERLTLAFSACDDKDKEYHFDNFNWVVIDEDFLHNKNLDALREVRITVQQPSFVAMDEEQLRADFMSRLPKLVQSGRLDVSIVENPFARMYR